MAVTTIYSEGTGGQQCQCLVIGRQQGKTVQKGQIMYSGMYRQKNVSLCAVNSIALYTFARWDRSFEQAPDFNLRQSWYNTKLFVGRDAQLEAEATTQNSWISKIFEECRISSSKVTHTFRASSAKIADALGVSQDDVSTLVIFYAYNVLLPTHPAC